MKAIWKDTVLAQSDATRVVEGNHYFPPDSIILPHFKSSPLRTVCGWKGEAHYYHIVVAGQVNENAAWYYPHPNEAAGPIRNYIAFWKGVEIVD